MSTPTPFALREELIELLRRDLLGPTDGPEEEILSGERLTQRYLVGCLAPGGSRPGKDGTPPGSDDAGTEADDTAETETGADTLSVAGTDEPDAPAEREPVLVDSLLPSCAGFSCLVDGEEQALLVRTSWGRYESGASRLLSDPKSGGPVTVWKRIPVTPAPVRLPLREGEDSFQLADRQPVYLCWRIRRRGDLWHVTLFLRNTFPKHRHKEGACWIFQVAMSAESDDGQQRPVFVQRQAAGMGDHSLLDSDEAQEMEALALRYRHCRIFGKGHGCAVRVEREPGDAPERARRLATDFLPVACVPGQTPRSAQDDPLLEGIVLDMKELAALPREGLRDTLERIIRAYAAWVDALPSGLAGTEFAPGAARAQNDARRALQRMQEGRDVLLRDAAALRAFRFANKAMYYQRIHSIYAARVHGTQPGVEERKKLLKETDQPRNRSWRLFQLAFLLCNVPTLSDPLHPERSGQGYDAVAELLWFATGGGKTEAYLGLTAFTLAMRRLHPDLGGLDAEHGVGVFMRYTLRLLTLQQFQRAAALICACEVLRRQDPQTWGQEPFRLGLWVGSRSTPNTLESAAREKDKGNRHSLGRDSSVMQFRTCPWCGAPITENNVSISKGTTGSQRCLTYCGDPDGQCSFSAARSPQEGLPVMVVDEEIYRRPPALLISTVDKFAQMPWKGEAGMLFGRVTGHCPRHGFLSPDVEESPGVVHRRYGPIPEARVTAHGWLRPPDLVIQDELHLISGPLGSMTALYENAVDTLCQWQCDGRTVRPKIIASTATIRRAAEQVRRLFNRRVEVFPPPGVDSRDNFFSCERPVDADCPGRVYMGICAIGRRMPPSTVRLYATALGAAQKLFNEQGDDADPWMTAVGYFNSIRELAGTRRLVEDEVRSRLADKKPRGLAPRTLGPAEELTSRQSSRNIPLILERLGNSFSANQPRESDWRKRPYDVVLATNMISVGVDIERLGLMIMLGQPRTTSEYIQASSRVGRSARAPGLVLTLYNWARPRDLSHFEDFYAYHAAFQRHVEALSVTPFASRALDRGLAGVLLSLVRQYKVVMNGNKTAGDLPQNEALFAEACRLLLERASAIMQDNDAENRLKKALEKLRDEWLTRIRRQTAVSLSYVPGSSTAGLMETPDKPQAPFSCPNSLRDVEKTVNLLLDTDPTGLSPRGE